MIIIIFVYNFGFGVSLGPIAWVYNADILPDTGLAIATTANWFSAFIIG